MNFFFLIVIDEIRVSDQLVFWGSCFPERLEEHNSRQYTPLLSTAQVASKAHQDGFFHEDGRYKEGYWLRKRFIFFVISFSDCERLKRLSSFPSLRIMAHSCKQ